jgi:hypothetical protein
MTSHTRAPTHPQEEGIFRRVPRSLRSWAFPISVFLVTRLIDVVFISLAARHQIALPRTHDGYVVTQPTPQAPGYLGVSANWDGQWYWRIALHGYPHSLPLTPAGVVDRNEWAFAPLFPALSRLLMECTGVDFALAGTLLATSMSAVAVVIVYQLVSETAGTFPARATTLVLCTSMAAPVFQIAYTEGPALMLVALALLMLRRRRYPWTALVLACLALTRHILAPFLVVLAVHAALRWVDDSRLGRPRHDYRPVVLLVLGTALAGVWPLTAALVTGRLTAFTDTQAQWRRTADTGPFGLFSVALELGGVPALAALALFAVAVAWVVLRPEAPAWGPEVRSWALAYPLYVLAVAPAAISLFRLLLIAFPLAWVFPDRGADHRRIQTVTLAVLVLTGLFLQWYWIRNFLVVGPLDAQFAYP